MFCVIVSRGSGTPEYCSRVALNKENEIVGYELINLGKMMDFIKKGIDANEALEKAKGHYGQWDNAAKYIDPRTDEETHSVASVFPVHE